SVDGDAPPRPLIRTPFAEHFGRISPDGKWIAYLSTEAGGNDAYVQSFPELGHKVRVSSDGAAGLNWMPASDGLIYPSPGENAMMSVRLEGRGDDLVPGSPHRLFGLVPDDEGSADLAHDGRRLLASVAKTGGTPNTVRIVLDWTALLKP